jgi:hypothetical protein
MKAFEKWYRNEPKDFHLRSQKEITEIAWRAALEWAYSQDLLSSGVPETCCSLSCRIESKIEEELGI